MLVALGLLQRGQGQATLWTLSAISGATCRGRPYGGGNLHTVGSTQGPLVAPTLPLEPLLKDLTVPTPALGPTTRALPLTTGL